MLSHRVTVNTHQRLELIVGQIEYLCNWIFEHINSERKNCILTDMVQLIFKYIQFTSCSNKRKEQLKLQVGVRCEV